MLKVEHLSFSYKEKNVLKNISFSLNSGEILAVLGKNAVGKTTLINILTGLLEANSGTITICGKDCTNCLNKLIKSKIGVMRPILGVFEKMTCFQYLEFVAGLYSVPRKRIFELSEKYQFFSELDQKIKNCSTGTRKKLEFCGAILHEPILLFLDEPFESIDPIVVSEIKEYIREFVKKGNAVIITSHILDIIQNICSNYIIIDDGIVTYTGKVNQEVKSTSENSLERVFLEMVGSNEKE